MNPALALPGVSSTYFRPSADFGRTMNVVSTGSGWMSRSSFRSRRALGLPLALGTGLILLTVPTRAPPIRTSLPFTRLAAFGTLAFRS